MRVWQANEDEWIAGETILIALRAACRALGRAWWEVIDREFFREVPANEWRTKKVYDPETPNNFDLTLSEVVAANAPGIVLMAAD